MTEVAERFAVLMVVALRRIGFAECAAAIFTAEAMVQAGSSPSTEDIERCCEDYLQRSDADYAVHRNAHRLVLDPEDELMLAHAIATYGDDELKIAQHFVALAHGELTEGST